MIIHAIALLSAFLFQGTGKLEIKDTTVGTGREVQANDVVTLDYAGTLVDGKQFDSSTGKPPLVFQVGKATVIKGMDQGVLGMKVGGERQLTIPSDLGYGDSGAGPDIPAKATLKFTLKLLRIDRTGDKQEIEKTVTKPGTGAAPQEGDVLDLHYTGTFLNGTKFDSSYDRKEPLHILTGHARLIKGFVQGIDGIHEGEKRRIVIPASLGYGPTDRGPIPGNSTLVFELEAVKVTPKAEVAKQIEADRKKLKIEDETKGSGAEIKNGDNISVKFTVSLADGKKLGGTPGAQAYPYQVGSGQVMHGLDVALVGMKAGEKAKVTVPPELAFGAAGAGNGAIPPNSTILLDIEIVKINP